MKEIERHRSIKKAAGDHWIQGAVKHPGSFTRSAKAHGKTVHEYAEEEKHASGKTGLRARLALTFAKMRHKKRSK